MSSKQQTKLIPKQMLVKGSKNYYNNVVGINSATIVLYSTAGFQKNIWEALAYYMKVLFSLVAVTLWC